MRPQHQSGYFLQVLETRLLILAREMIGYECFGGRVNLLRYGAYFRPVDLASSLARAPPTSRRCWSLLSLPPGCASLSRAPRRALASRNPSRVNLAGTRGTWRPVTFRLAPTLLVEWFIFPHNSVVVVLYLRHQERVSQGKPNKHRRFKVIEQRFGSSLR